MFDLISDIISRVSTTTRLESKIDSVYIGKGGALNRGLRFIKQLIRVFGAYWRDISGSELRLTRCSAYFCSTTVVIFILSQLQLLLTSYKPFYIAFINIEKDSR